METLIFVDVDGVLNVCARDPTCRSGGAVLLSDANVATCLKALQGDENGLGSHPTSVRLMATCGRDVGGGEEEQVYGAFVCSDTTKLCDIMVRRLAKLLNAAAAAGPHKVILSSSWRKPEHRAYLVELECQLSRNLGRHFEFDDRTSLMKDKTPEDRLRAVGHFVARYAASRQARLRILMLEDFMATPLDGSWCCDGRPIANTSDCEQFILKCVMKSCPHFPVAELHVRIVHTYDHWLLSSKDGRFTASEEVHIGCGLTWPNFSSALEFLEKDIPAFSPLRTLELFPSRCGGSRGSRWVRAYEGGCNTVLAYCISAAKRLPYSTCFCS